jgi:membrane protein DedA with SNARE-associated domain
MILHYLTDHQTLGYLIIFIGTMVEGDILLFTAGFLTHQGYFDIGTVIFLVFSGVIIGDNLWYVLGELMREREYFKKFRHFIGNITDPFNEQLKNRTARTIFISKFAYGLYRPILLKAGTLRLPFRQFIEADLMATFVWMFLIGGLGYLGSASFLLIRRYLRYTELTLLLGIAVFILISHIVTKISKKEL